MTNNANLPAPDPNINRFPPAWIAAEQRFSSAAKSFREDPNDLTAQEAERGFVHFCAVVLDHEPAAASIAAMRREMAAVIAGVGCRVCTRAIGR